MANIAPYFRPPHAVTMWCDDNWIYAELPCEGDPPYICKFAFTEGGLSKALRVLLTARRDKLPSTVSAKVAALPGHIARISHPRLKHPKPTTSPEQLAKARELIRKRLGK